MRDLPRLSVLEKEVEDLGLDEKDDKDEIAELKDSAHSLHKENLKLFAMRRQHLNNNKIRLFGVIWGQCSASLQSEISSLQDLTTYNHSNKY